jgi:hypothetical protein
MRLSAVTGDALHDASHNLFNNAAFRFLGVAQRIIQLCQQSNSLRADRTS